MDATKDKLSVQKDYIIQLFDQLTADYQKTREERQEISNSTSNLAEEILPLEELEWLTVNIRGYASQIKATGQVENGQQAIAQLQRLTLTGYPDVAQLYEQARSQYPQIHLYIRLLDYLRLLTLEYLQMQQAVSLSA
jgi:hypothetical protein